MVIYRLFIESPPQLLGRYARVPMQDDEPPVLPDRNNVSIQPELRNNNNNNSFSSRNNLATQKLHEILTTPRKPRSKSEDRNLSPGKIDRGTPHRGGSQFTPPISATTSPTGNLLAAYKLVTDKITEFNFKI